MPTQSLFSLLSDSKPAPDRREPTLWLKRLVVLSSLDSSAVIREISFRCGLNVIQTRQMVGRGGPVAGHSVGKTLLMRLIRYTLGESHFGAEETEVAVESAFESSFVIGHWSVAGADWIVVRPLEAEKSSHSFAARSDDWQRVVDGPIREARLRDFVHAVEEAVLGGLPTFKLRRGREAKWLDVLAWLSRDYQCGYRKANEWRHNDANSGPSLDRSENSQVMQWLLGLMSPDEVELWIAHRNLLEDHQRHSNDADNGRKRLETLQPSLWAKLELSEDTEIVDGQATFDSIDPVVKVEQKIRTLNGLRQERLATSKVAELEAEQTEVQDKLTDIEATIRSCRSTLQFIEKQIAEIERDPLKPFAFCQANPCWVKQRAEEFAGDPASGHHASVLREQRDEQQRKMDAAIEARKDKANELQGKNERLIEERGRIAKELAGIDESLGKWKGYKDDADAYRREVAAVADADASEARLKSAVDLSLANLETVRREHSREVSRLSDVYQQTLQRIFSDAASGRIQVDGNGIQPVPDKRLAPAGAALSVMTTVLAFDVACVAASIAGIGRHPRFLMHDSPREGDMEGPLFSRLFEVVVDLESQFADLDHIWFQYIVTTTTAPPAALGDENGPYVRETLDARTDDGLLLRKRF